MQTSAASEPVITCPHCGREIKLTETLAAPFIEAARQKYEEEGRRRDEALKLREEAVRKETAKLERDRVAIDEQVEVKLGEERKALEDRVKKKAQEEIGLEMKDLREEIDEKGKKLREAQELELQLRKKAQKLDEDRQELELQKQRELDEERGKIREAAQKELAEKYRLKDAENEKIIGDMKKTIEELQRKADQGSQQLQGEVQELDLEDTLRTAFPGDTVEPVPKGQHGGDCLQRVIVASGVVAGTILWESKRTKNWSDGWLPKLRDDQRLAKAEIAVVVSAVLPKGIDQFGLVDGVWVTNLPSAVPLATALRQSVQEVHAVRQAGVGKQSKMELLYAYMCGPEFRHRIEAIVEAYNTMRSDLEAEKRAIMKHWAKREKQLARTLESTVTMYGELHAIAGSSLPELENLEMRALESRAEDESAGGAG